MEEIIIKTQGGKHIKYINDIFGIEIIPINAQHAPTSPYWPSTINHGQEAIINFITNTAEYEINFADITVINADYDLIIEEWDGSPGGDYGNYWGYLTLSNPTGPVKVIIDNTWFGYYDNGISGLVTNRFRVNNNILEIKTLSNGTGIIPGEAFSASNDHGYGLPSQNIQFLEFNAIKIFKGITQINNYAFDRRNFDTIYYTGSEEDWNQIIIDEQNSEITNANVIYNA